MTLTQLKTLINTSLTTAGYEMGGLSDLSWVDIGTAINSLTADQFKSYLQEFALGVIKNEFDTRRFEKSLDISTSFQEYNGIKQYIKAGFIQAEDVASVALVSGQDYNDRVYKALTTDVLLATKDEGFGLSWSVPQQELKMLFSSEEGAMGYVALIEGAVANSYNRNKWNIQLSLINRLIISANDGGRVVHLVTAYNACHTPQVTTSDCLESADFKNWVKEQVANLKSYMEDISSKYNDGQILTFTPKEDVKLIMNTSFSNALKNITTFNGIGEGALDLGDYQTVNAWYNNGTALLPDIGTTGNVAAYVDGTLKSVSYCAAVLFDKFSANMTLKVDKNIRSDYVPKGDFTNFFADFVGQSFVNTRNNAVILLLD